MADDDVISELEQVTPAWLTSVLSRGDALTLGGVESFEVDTGGGTWSTNARLALSYTQGARGTLPPRLFLKMVETNLNGESFGPSEVTYYTRDYLGVEGVPLIRCYDGAYSEQEQRYHLLLDDLSETHVQAATRAPTLEYGLALAEGLAAMHAHWWGADRLAQVGAPIHADEHIRRFVDIAEPGAGHILGTFSSQLEPHWPELIRSLYARHPGAIIERARDPEGFTLIHGDANCTNILVPRDADRPIYIIDRQPFDWSLTTWLGVYDLFYALVLDWNVELRRRFEVPVLRRYHERLAELGVSGYSWDRLWEDYRLSAAMGVYVATEYCRGGVNEQLAWVWLPMLQRSLSACDDLDCQELW